MSRRMHRDSVTAAQEAARPATQGADADAPTGSLPALGDLVLLLVAPIGGVTLFKALGVLLGN